MLKQTRWGPNTCECDVWFQYDDAKTNRQHVDEPWVDMSGRTRTDIVVKEFLLTAADGTEQMVSIGVPVTKPIVEETCAFHSGLSGQAKIDALRSESVRRMEAYVQLGQIVGARTGISGHDADEQGLVSIDDLIWSYAGRDATRVLSVDADGRLGLDATEKRALAAAPRSLLPLGTTELEAL